MVRSKKILPPLVVALLAISPILAEADDEGKKLERTPLSMFNLTEDQLAQWGQLKKAHQETLREHALELRVARERVKIAFQSSDSETEIRETAAALSSLLQTIQSSRLDHQIAVIKGAI